MGESESRRLASHNLPPKAVFSYAVRVCLLYAGAALFNNGALEAAASLFFKGINFAFYVIHGFFPWKRNPSGL